MVPLPAGEFVVVAGAPVAEGAGQPPVDLGPRQLNVRRVLQRRHPRLREVDHPPLQRSHCECISLKERDEMWKGQINLYNVSLK